MARALLSSLTGTSSIIHVLHIVVPNLLHVPHVKRADLQGTILVAANHQQIFVSPPGRALRRSDKSFLRETDWNNGGDFTLNGFLLRCSARLSTASEEQKEREARTRERERKAFHNTSAELSKGYTE